MSNRPTKYTEQEVRDAASQSYSTAELLEKIGLVPVGGNYKTIKKKLIEWDIDTSHFTGQGWRKGSTIPMKKAIPLQEILDGKHPFFGTHNLRLRLLKEGIFEHKCQCCGNIEWMNQPIPLELDHIDGNNTNHSLENIRLLCPNCHSQTATFRGKNKQGKGGARRRMEARQKADKEEVATKSRNTKYKAVSCDMCCNFLMKKQKRFCSQECSHLAQNKIDWSKIDLISLVEKDRIPFTTLSKQLLVSDNAIRKHYIKLIDARNKESEGFAT